MPTPGGNNAETEHFARQQATLQVENQIYDSEDIVVKSTTRGRRLYLKNKPPQAAPSGFPWQTPNKELDPMVSVTQNTFVYISPNNPLTSVGLVDLVSNQLEKSRPGIWQALQDVPAQNGAGAYNVPQVPYPTNGGPVAGSPLSGDADDANNYWILWSPTPYC